MKRGKAIEIVKSAFSAWESEFRVPNDDWSEEHEALDMAIEALQSTMSQERVNHESTNDLISRADAIEAICNAQCELDVPHYPQCDQIKWCDEVKALLALPSAEAEPKMMEEVREALMRLTMCAREECAMCKYKDKCGFDFQYDISTENMNTILDSLMRSKCEVDAKSAEAEWIPCSEMLPKEEKKTYWVCTDAGYQCECRWTNNRFGIGEGEWGWSIFDTPQYTKPIAWMPLPEPYMEEGEA